MNKFLEDDVVFLRALEPTDLDTLYGWENNTELWQFGNTLAPYSRALLWEYLQNYDGDIYKSRQIRLIVENNDGIVVGTVDLYDFDAFNNRISLGILIDPQFQGLGYGYHAVMLSVDYCDRFLGIGSVYVTIPEDNVYSVNLFKKCGFSESGILRRWLKRGHSYVDAVFMQYLPD